MMHKAVETIIKTQAEKPFFIITSAKELMFLFVFFCLCVC